MFGSEKDLLIPSYTEAFLDNNDEKKKNMRPPEYDYVMKLENKFYHMHKPM